jgi:hypothetical protein
VLSWWTTRQAIRRLLQPIGACRKRISPRPDSPATLNRLFGQTRLQDKEAKMVQLQLAMVVMAITYRSLGPVLTMTGTGN